MHILNKKNLKLIRLILAVIGIIISLYLMYAKLTSSPIFCKFGDCDLVQQSEYSEIMGIPVSYFGVFYYLIMVFLVWYKDEVTQEKQKKQLRLAFVGWVVWGVVYSTYLTYLELYVINAICMWCVFSYLVVLGLLKTIILEKFVIKPDVVQ